MFRFGDRWVDGCFFLKKIIHNTWCCALTVEPKVLIEAWINLVNVLKKTVMLFCQHYIEAVRNTWYKTFYMLLFVKIPEKILNNWLKSVFFPICLFCLWLFDSLITKNNMNFLCLSSSLKKHLHFSFCLFF